MVGSNGVGTPQGPPLVPDSVPAAPTVRVRFAPSPTGALHIGGARTALFNWLFARHHGGTFILRVEDTDQGRLQAGSVEGILEGLRWLGLTWDEGPDIGGPAGPYYQSQRLPLYRERLDQLVAAGLAYQCYCTPEELAARREEARAAGRPPRYDGRCRELSAAEGEGLAAEGRQPVLRLAVDAAGETVVDDLIRGPVVFHHSDLDDFIIAKADGFPTYNFACAADDAAQGITHCLRAEEHLSNTPKQLLVYQALGTTPPRFAHVPMILAPDRSKLSKRHGATSVQEFRDQGFLAAAMVNYLTLLGWSAGGSGDEKLPLDMVVSRFTLERVGKNAAIYDVQKLRWLNGVYLRELAPAELVQAALPFLQRRGLLPECPSPEQLALLERAVPLLRERADTLDDLAAGGEWFFRPPAEYDAKGVAKHFADREGAGSRLGLLAQSLGAVEAPWRENDLEEAYTALATQLGVSRGALIHPTRLAVTGRTIGPGLFELMAALGRAEVLARMEAAREFLA